jgi:cytochrome c biogenesis factor
MSNSRNRGGIAVNERADLPTVYGFVAILGFLLLLAGGFLSIVGAIGGVHALDVMIFVEALLAGLLIIAVGLLCFVIIDIRRSLERWLAPPAETHPLSGRPIPPAP